MDPLLQPVSLTQSESLIASVEHATPDPRAGIFGADSITWHINRESALFLGAGRAALLQLAHPWVATALQQHSSLIERPIARFHSTFRIVFTMIFGTLSQATGAARHLYEFHTHIQGSLPQPTGRWSQGSHYQANEIAALRWVYATLIESAVLAYQTVLPPLTPSQLAAYYAESRTLAGLFGMASNDLPADWQSFLSYCREMEQSADLGITDAARSMAHSLLRGAGSWLKPPHWYRALTTAWLPQRLRAEFPLPFTPDDEISLAAARLRLPRWYRRLPPSLRYVGPYQEAQSRLANRRPGPITHLSNRFWIGQSKMPFA